MNSPCTTEISLFHQFIGERYINADVPLDDAVHEFREYQRELADLKAKLRVAEEQSARGETGPIDFEDVKRRLDERIARARSGA